MALLLEILKQLLEILLDHFLWLLKLQQTRELGEKCEIGLEGGAKIREKLVLVTSSM